MDEGGCEGYCCNTIGSYYCKCPEGSRVGPDGKACHGKMDYCMSLVCIKKDRLQALCSAGASWTVRMKMDIPCVKSVSYCFKQAQNITHLAYCTMP